MYIFYHRCIIGIADIIKEKNRWRMLLSDWFFINQKAHSLIQAFLNDSLFKDHIKSIHDGGISIFTSLVSPPLSETVMVPDRPLLNAITLLPREVDLSQLWGQRFSITEGSLCQSAWSPTTLLDNSINHILRIFQRMKQSFGFFFQSLQRCLMALPVWVPAASGMCKCI